MRKLTADYIFDGNEILQGKTLVVEQNGTVLDLINNSEAGEDVEKHEGMLCPGFVNTHCHLELSHMKGKVTEGKGLVQFIKELQTQREADEDVVQQALKDADEEMYNNGIVAVGDISNGSDSFKVKAQSKLYYHTFIELYGFLEEGAETSLENGLALAKQLEELKLSHSLVPHSPYAGSRKLISLITHQSANAKVVCMHNQETDDENRLFMEGKGSFIDLMHWFGIDTAFWVPSGKGSLVSIADHLPNNTNLLLVHNTFTQQHDIDRINKHNEHVYWAFCPNANQYIENAIPDIPLFLENVQRCTIGTDSLTSNWSLSVLDELKTIAKHYPKIEVATLLKMATLSGSQALGVEKALGSFSRGKLPGVNLLKLSSYSPFQLSDYKVSRLL